MLIRIDTREQHPLDFDRCAVVRDTIPTFDYSIEGDQLHFAVERKSLPDLIQSLAIQKNYCRELKKLRRARSVQKMPRIFYVVEANREDIEHFDFSIFTGGRVGPDFIFHQLSELEYFQDVHVIFSGDALGAARDIYRLLKRRAEDLKQQEGEYLVLAGAAAGKNGDFQPLTPDRNVRLPLIGTCNPGDTLVIADPSVEGQPGKVVVLPEDAGTYRAVAIAEEKGVAGQLVLARPANLGLITVTE